MSDYTFTQDWFQWAPPVWEQLIPMLPDRKNFLEIGSFEGRSTVWTVENMMEDGGSIVAIDTWEGGEEHTHGEMSGAEARFDKNIELVTKKFPERKVLKAKKSSYYALAHRARWLPAHQTHFDFIYIDGSHTAKDVMTDACMAWPLLKRKGIMVFDDYMWAPQGFTPMQRPKIAIDMFVNLFETEIEFIHLGYQYVIRKI